MVAAAIVGAAVVGAAATSYAGSKSSQATTAAANTAAGEQQWAVEQGETMSAPYRSLGNSAIGQYSALLGLTGPNGTGGPANANTLAALQATPGYQFTQQQGDMATKNAAAASGMLLSGNTLAGLDQYNTGLADQTYQNAVQNAQGAVGIGQAAAAGQASQIQSAATNEGNIAVNQGNTLASIDANEAAGISSALGNAAGSYMQYQTLSGLNDPGAEAGAGGVMYDSAGYGYNVPG